MTSFTAALQSSRTSFYSGAILATCLGAFAATHIQAFIRTNELYFLIICISETLTATFYLLRSTPKSVSILPFDWLIAIAGTIAPLFLRPASWGILPMASISIILGTIIQILGVISLNRSFAIIAARRVIKTTWMYRLVRHPIYASYVLIYSGYVLANTTPLNILIYLLTVTFLVLRIIQEERHLSSDPGYCEYMKKVRYRLIPLLF